MHIHKSPPTTPKINIHHLPKGTTSNTTLRFFVCKGGNLPSPFMDILPRIFDLSLDSKDRRTRMAACEVLHVMIIYIIGNK